MLHTAPRTTNKYRSAEVTYSALYWKVFLFEASRHSLLLKALTWIGMGMDRDYLPKPIQVNAFNNSEWRLASNKKTFQYRAE